MNKGEIITLFNGLNTCGNLVGQKFGYFVARNLNILKPEVEKIEEARKALIDNYAKKVDGKPLIENSSYIFENKQEFDAEFKKLMDEELEIKTFTIKLDEIPKEATTGQIGGIFDLITE